MRPRLISVAVAVAVMIAAAPTPRAPGWVWPVEGPRVVIRAYVSPSTPYGAGHRGVDLAAAAVGTPVRAVMSGTVHFAGTVVDRGAVTLRSAQLLATVEPVTPLVVAGQRVRAGDVIGTLGGGHCSVPCLHLGVRLAGEYVSPLLYLGGLRRAVLLPLELPVSHSAPGGLTPRGVCPGIYARGCAVR